MEDNASVYRQATITVRCRYGGDEREPYQPNVMAALEGLDMALHALNLAGGGYPLGAQGRGPYGAAETAMRVALTEGYGAELAERIIDIRVESGEDMAYCIDSAKREAAELAAEATLDAADD
ncbi:hypothetical protein I0C86_41250 [Plantactinospora sp. S1510]|uniref:Uncharacterized protein n=1 Tax=Plantactinospora alkalitolerans TaxID=2789879 RepID=A0ABS0H9Y7_9ACTN|nr:hypothetical protein [Plantactinospora alkalitolerans]MBF9135280.1 hypothetical protein [Plantactinospora alkalitolerans]